MGEAIRKRQIKLKNQHNFNDREDSDYDDGEERDQDIRSASISLSSPREKMQKFTTNCNSTSGLPPI